MAQISILLETDGWMAETIVLLAPSKAEVPWENLPLYSPGSATELGFKLIVVTFF